MTKLPLHRLMAQLQAAGFDITAHEWYRLELALSQHQELLQSPAGLQELGLILGPLLCKNDKEQEIFQQLYQQYLDELPKGGRTIIEEVQAPKNAHWWLPALLTVGLLLISIPLLNWYKQNYGMARNFDRFDYEYDLGEGRFAVGDTIRLINRTAPEDTLGVDFWWYIKDNNNRVRDQHFGYDNPAWIFSTPVGEDHRIQLIVRPEGDSTGQVFAGREESFRVYCAGAPEITGLIEVAGVHRPGEPLQFSVEATGTDLEYRWTINGAEIIDPNPTYTFEEPDTYPIRVQVRDTSGKAGRCYDEISYQLEIEDDSPKPVLVSMPPLTLQKDSEAIEYFFPVWLIVLIGLLTALAAALWTIWYYQRKNFHQKKAEQRAAKLAAIQVNDKAPYEIPFASRQSEIRKSALQFNMANVLRRRQEGTRQILDVPQTIRHTVEGGGYLDLQFRYNTRPTDYLFLIDRASAESHQARLFVYLTETLRDQDVHVDYWTYRGDFNRFWNPGYEGSLSLDQLYKTYIDRKLIIFGDGESLLDRQRAKDTLDTFGRWKYRLLVTPRPLASWSSKEKRLYPYFPIFPANLQSLMEAVRLVEREWEPEDLPANFRDWQAQLERKMPEDPDSEQRWRHWSQYKTYLQQHPELLPWLKALVVHPDLRWDLTIAIGKALDAPVTFDNLLILSRIPDFNQGAFPVRVWREIWPQLDLEQEWTARRRVKAELEAISAEAVQNSYAEQSLQTDLALQNFALEPYNKDHQEAIRLRLETGQIDKLRQEELDQIIERQTDTEVPEDAGRGDYTDAFLRKQETKEKPPVRTPIFWWATALTLFSILGWTGLISLDWQALGEYFMEEKEELPFYLDSHQAEFRQLNNTAVENLYPNDLAPDKADILGNGPYSIELLKGALAMRPDYTLAQDNLEKLYYLTGQEYYEGIVNDETLEQAAYDNFQLALEAPEVRPNRDSTDFFAFHGLASIQHTKFRPDSACVYLDSIRTHFPDLLLKYAGSLLYLNGCEQEEGTDVEQEQATLPEEEIFYYGEQFLFAFAGDVLPTAAENQGLQVIRSMGGLNRGTTGLDWIEAYNKDNEPDIVHLTFRSEQNSERAFELNPGAGYKGEHYARIITRSTYPNLPSLSYPATHGNELATVLRGYGYVVERVSELSDLPLRNRLQSYQEQFFGENDQLLIYYAGYAYSQAGETFIVPLSGFSTTPNSLQTEPAGLDPVRGLNLNEVRSLINAIPCQRVMLLLDLVEVPANDTQQTVVPSQLPQDNVAKISLFLGTREHYSNYGFIIDELDGDLIIATPHFPLSEENTKLYGPDYRVQLKGLTQPRDAELIDAYDQDSLAFLRLPKPAGFNWNFDDLHHDELSGNRYFAYYLRNSSLENTEPFSGTLTVDIEGYLKMELDDRDAREHLMPFLGGNLIYAENQIAGFVTNSNTRTGTFSGLSLDFIENTLQQLVMEQDDTSDYQLPPDFPLPEMVSIQGGTFTMGCTEGIRELVGEDCEEDETPHRVSLDNYQLATTEVTFAQYDAFCEATGREKPEDEGWGRGTRPVMNISWYDAIEFCNWLSRATEREPVYTIDGEQVTPNWQADGYRLPTEAEWEYAARERGRDVVFGNGKNIADPAEMNFDASVEYKVDYSVVGTYRGQTVPVASLNSPNALGLHDMSGNVWEWCWDWYGDYPETNELPVPNPKGAANSSGRLFRGGSWFNGPAYLRCSFRFNALPDVRSYYVGFRLSRAAR